MSRNAYEIRMDLLRQAHEMLFADWHNRQEVANLAGQMIERAPEAINAPSIDEVLALAEKLRGFVDKANWRD